MIYKIMEFISKFSKKTSIYFLIGMTILAITALSLLVSGLIYLTPTDNSTPLPFAVPLVVAGSVLVFFEAIMITLAALSSNYMRKMEKNKEQYEKYMQEKKDKVKKKKTEREE